MRCELLTGFYFQPRHHILRRGHVMVTEPYVARGLINRHVTNQRELGGQGVFDKCLGGRIKSGHTVGGGVTDPHPVSLLIDFDNIRLSVPGRRGPFSEG